MTFKSLRQQKADKCVHFNGIQNDECDAGIRYDDVRVEGCGMPCLRGDGPFRNGESLSCEKRHWPTEEELDAMMAESERRMVVMFAGLEAVAVDAEKRGLGKRNGGTGEVKCPCCENGTIHYRVSGYNGHRHARCTTEGCVAFME